MEEDEAEQLKARQGARPRRERMLNVRALQELSGKRPEEILMRLASEGGGLDQLLKDSSISPERMMLFLRLVERSFVDDMLQSQYENIKCIIDCMLSRDNNFLNDTLYSFFIKCVEDMQMVARAVLFVSDFAFFIMPTFARPRVIQFKVLLRDRLDVSQGQVRARLERLEKACESQTGQGGRAGDKRVHGIKVSGDDAQAGENFRALPLIPTQQELTGETEIFLKSNRDTGTYASLEEYLDVQFRLFRADLILPLKENIEKYLGSHHVGEDGCGVGPQGIRVYRHVQIIRPVCTDKDLAHRLSFSPGSVDWRRSQRLKFGSLLCLSSDNFASCIFAVVHERDVSLLRKGLVDVVFVLTQDQLIHITDAARDQRFVMVESPAYFEAYRHVLLGLQNLNDHNFPFIQHIVHCQPDIQPPQYLRRPARYRYDFTPLLDPDFVVSGERGFHDNNDDGALGIAADGVDGTADDEDGDNADRADDADRVRNVRPAFGRKVDVISAHGWPTRAELGLDETQFQSLHSALTRELCIIQGPPGTGKTFVGLKVVRMLLHNSAAWDDRVRPRPLLVVCYSNHALDQFLESVLDFFSGSLVRVGARSKSERLQEKTLAFYRTRARANRGTPMEIHEAKARARLEMQSLRLEIHRKAAQLELAEREIVKEEVLQDFINPAAMEALQRSTEPEGRDTTILTWLNLAQLHRRLSLQAEQDLKKLPPVKALRQALPLAPPLTPDCDNEEDSDEETVEELVRDSMQARQLDADDVGDDDDFLSDLDLEEFEESEASSIRRRLKDMETEMLLLRMKSVALDLSSLCENGEEMAALSVQVSREERKAIGERLHRLRRTQWRILQGKLHHTDRMTVEEAEKVRDVWRLPMKDRWRLYRCWVDVYCRQKRGEIRQQEQTYFRLAGKYREILHQEDRAILEAARVIGMTTTGAARYQSVLQAIGPRVIVVEEAAEVFESHVVVTLSQECQHLILIGDHKQLRPNPTVHDLAKKCNLDVSLFERMIRNQFPFDCLGYQHRMRPEISLMMRLPELYPQLKDAAVVKGLPAVRGVRHNVFYINHSHPETRDEETKTYSNAHEAAYLVALCSYLLKQGYAPTQIVILAPYSGQIRLISDMMPKKAFDGVRVSSVDNFQGEESDIVLLSLVRSNNDNSIGFLKIDNRICVALSRAKRGLYVIGNFETLQRCGGLLEKVVMRAGQQKILGEGLPLFCHNHPRAGGILACYDKDFDKAPEGGCRQQCEARLVCGHQCLRTCHPNEGHEDMICPLPCRKVCGTCGQRCQDTHCCSDHTHCTRLTDKVLPRCRHSQMVPCGVDPLQVECQADCQVKLPCGHQCQDRCGQQCSRQCKVLVTMTTAPCGHAYEAKCCEQNTAPCSYKCGQELVCGHTCQGTCGGCHGGRLHVPCQQGCRKILVCGHDCTGSCCQCPPCPAACQNRCPHSRCDRACGEACVQCVMDCGWRCPHQACSKGCGELCDRDRCNEPCPKTLDCGHPCVGLCLEPCPSHCRVCTPEALDDPVFGTPEPDDRFVQLMDCGHVFEVTSLDQWVDMSAKPGTNEEVSGRPEDEVSGSPEDEGEREEQVSHDSSDPGTEQGGALVAEGGENSSLSRQVRLPECPQCKTPIRCSLRYGNVVKKALRDLEAIKQKCRGNETELDRLVRKVDSARARVPQGLRAKIEKLLQDGGLKSEWKLRTQFYQLSAATDVFHMLSQLASAITRWPSVVDTYLVVRQDLDLLLAWLLLPRNVLSDRQHLDARQEFARLRTLLHLLHCKHSISQDELDVEKRLFLRVTICVRQLMKFGPVSDRDLDEGRELTEALKDMVPDPYSALTEQEREQIVKAIQLPVGHWYACPRGHYYAIGECGRPLENAVCPDCHSPIGGEHHALASANRPAPEFDNAQGPAWSEEEDFALALRMQQEIYDNWH